MRRRLRRLHSEIERWREVDGYSIAFHLDPEPPSYSIRANGIREPEESLALLVGDCLHNARAALEYIAFALGEQGAGGQISEAEARRSTFPIVGDLDADRWGGTGVVDRLDRSLLNRWRGDSRSEGRAPPPRGPYVVGGSC